MAIPDFARANFDTLLRAAANGDLTLLECTDRKTGAPRYVLCAVSRNGEDYLFAPFGHLADGDSYKAYAPPSGKAPLSH